MFQISGENWRATSYTGEWSFRPQPGDVLTLPGIERVPLCYLALQASDPVVREICRLGEAGALSSDELNVRINFKLPAEAYITRESAECERIAMLQSSMLLQIGSSKFAAWPRRLQPTSITNRWVYGNVVLIRRDSDNPREIVFGLFRTDWLYPELLGSITLDHIESLVIPKIGVRDYSRELFTLQTYAEGLHSIAVEIAHLEGKHRSRYDREFGQLLAQPDTARVILLFDWYAVTACNFVRLLGWFAKWFGIGRETPRQYLERICGPLLIWRDKVAAHPARVSQRDHEVDRRMSMVRTFGWVESEFRVGDLQLSIGSSRSSLQPWGITSTHRDFTNRFWRTGRHYVPKDYIITMDGKCVYSRDH
jgi:hypothetical protein